MCVAAQQHAACFLHPIPSPSTPLPPHTHTPLPLRSQPSPTLYLPPFLPFSQVHVRPPTIAALYAHGKPLVVPSVVPQPLPHTCSNPNSFLHSDWAWLFCFPSPTSHLTTFKLACPCLMAIPSPSVTPYFTHPALFPSCCALSPPHTFPCQTWWAVLHSSFPNRAGSCRLLCITHMPFCQ